MHVGRSPSITLHEKEKGEKASLTHKHAQTHTYTRMHARTHAHTIPQFTTYSSQHNLAVIVQHSVGTTDNSSSTPDRMWSIHMAQYDDWAHIKALACSKIINTNNPNKKQKYSKKLLPVSRRSALQNCIKKSRCQIKTEPLTIHHTHHRMWNFRMAQYTMTVYTSTHSPALGPFKSTIETKNTETGNINLLPVSRQFALHNCTKGTSCQAKTEALIIHHPHLTACGTFTWLSTRWLSTRQGTRQLWDHKYK